jgi:hypothetical protein
MPRRAAVALAALLLALFAGSNVASVSASSAAPSGAGSAAAVVAWAATPPPTDPPTTVVDNPFIPEGNLGDCISAVPKPGCGSEAKGGWRQGLVLGVMVLGLAFVGWRITRTVRRNRRALEQTGGG